MTSPGKPSAGGLRIIVMGYVVRGPLGGLTWHHLQYLIGLAALGHCTHFLEDSDDYPSCYDPVRGVTDSDPAYGLSYATEVFKRSGFGERWAYHDAHTRRWHGPRAGDILRLCSEADVLLNVSGVNPLRPWVRGIPARALIDTDPVFTQIRHLKDPAAMARAAAHTAFFTFGENFGQPDCTIPDDGLRWIATRQPIVLDAWPVRPPAIEGRFTSVMQWESYAEAEHRGERYGMKSLSFQPYVSLPSRVRPRLELALGGEGAPRSELLAQGWAIRDPLEVTRDPWTYQDYIQGSRGEFAPKALTLELLRLRPHMTDKSPVTNMWGVHVHQTRQENRKVHADHGRCRRKAAPRLRLRHHL